MAKYFLTTFSPDNAKAQHFRGGVGYKSGTKWLFENSVPVSIKECGLMEIRSITENEAMDYMTVGGVIYNHYLDGETDNNQDAVDNQYKNIEVGPNTTVDNKTAVVFDEDALVERIAGIIDKKINGIALNANEAKIAESFENELSIDEVRAKVYVHSEQALMTNSDIGNKTESKTEELDSSVQLLKNIKDDQEPRESLQEVVISEVDDIAEDNEVENDIRKPPQAEEDEFEESIIQSNPRTERISDMLKTLKDSQASQK